MTAYGIVQALVLVLAIGGSVVYALRQYFPKGLRLRLGAWLQKPAHASWMRTTGTWLMPATEQGCDSGCGSCGGCGSEKNSSAERPLVFAASGSRQKSRTGSP